MATPSVQTILNAIKAELDSRIVSGGTLAFMVGENNSVFITNEEPELDDLANYKNYQIIMFPDADSPFTEEHRLGNNVFREFNVGFSVFRKAAKRAQGRIFSDANDAIRGTGVYEFLNLVMDSLRNNTFGGVCERRSAPQFSGPTMGKVEQTLSERADFTFHCETLTSITAGAIA